MALSPFATMLYLPEDDERIDRLIEARKEAEEESMEESFSDSESSGGPQFTLTRRELIKRVRENNPDILIDNNKGTVVRAQLAKKPAPSRVSSPKIVKSEPVRRVRMTTSRVFGTKAESKK